MKPPVSFSLMFGADPEVFVRSKEGLIVASDKVLGESKVCIEYANTTKGAIARDGVQVELQPRPAMCRQVLGGNFYHLLKSASQAAQTVGGILSFEPVVTLDEKSLEAMSDDCKVLGCQPSMNIYGVHDIDEALANLGYTKRDYPVRSAGGHIHLGFEKRLRDAGALHTLVALLDVTVGLPCVLLDRDPRAAERRQVYGRAGEYREQPHGLEYRTLSNFWLRDWLLTHLVLQMTRWAFLIWGGDYQYQSGAGSPSFSIVPVDNPHFANDVLKEFKPDEVQQAINLNDAERALPMVKKLMEMQAEGLTTAPFNANYQQDFFFSLADKGLDTVFPVDSILARWMDISMMFGGGRGRGYVTAPGWEAQSNAYSKQRAA